MDNADAIERGLPTCLSKRPTLIHSFDEKDFSAGKIVMGTELVEGRVKETTWESHAPKHAFQSRHDFIDTFARMTASRDRPD